MITGPAQLSFEDYRHPRPSEGRGQGEGCSDPSEVCQLIDLLSASGSWLTAEQITEQIGWNDRKIRKLAAESDGLIISGNHGYKHTRHATPDELAEFWGRMVSQGKQMIARAILAKRKHHQLVG